MVGKKDFKLIAALMATVSKNTKNRDITKKEVIISF